MSDVYPNTITKIIKDYKLKDAILIQCFPGQGYVGKIAGMHLIDYFKAKKGAKIYSSYFPHVVFFQGSLGKLIHAEIYVIEETTPPIVVLTGETQPQEGPEGMFQVLGAVLDLAKKWGISQVIAIGGFRPANVETTPEITAFAYTDKDVDFLKKYDVPLFTEGRVSGAVGVLTALASEKGFKSFGIMGKVHPGERSQIFIDPQASKNVLIALSKMFGFKLDLTKMDEMIAKIEKAEAKDLKAIEELARKQDKSDSRNYYI